MKRKRTSIRNLARILVFENMAQIVKAEYQYKAQSVSDEIKPIDKITMLESIESLDDNVVFSDFVDWTYSNVLDSPNAEDFIVYGDVHDSMVGTIVVMYLKATSKYTVEEIEQMLNETVFSRNVK